MRILNTTPFTDDFLLKVSKGKSECKGYDSIECLLTRTQIEDSELGCSHEVVLSFCKDNKLLGTEILILSHNGSKSLGFVTKP